MPQGDGTGPNGAGPMTGRAMGYCAGFNSPGFMNLGFGRGAGRGMAFRRGFGRGFAWRARAMPIQVAVPQTVQPVMQPAVITKDEEKQYLQEELKILKQEMQEIEKRLKEIK